jgi:hypothetical protein
MTFIRSFPAFAIFVPPRLRMTEHTNTSGLLHSAPIEGNQSFDHSLPSWSGKLSDIELLAPAARITGGFRSTHGKKEARQPGRERRNMPSP